MMKRIKCIGLNHHAANTEQREKTLHQKLSPEQIYSAFKKDHPDTGLIVISTCNRFEIVFDSSQKLNELRDYFVDLFKLKDLKQQVVSFEDQDAVQHIIEVTASLDSMIVGETQITGQVKEAFRESKDLGACTTNLQKIMEIAFSATKKIRQNTGLGEKSVSIAQSGIDLASRIFEFKDKTILIIGAGQMAKVACQHLTSKKVANIIVANRTIERAAILSDQFNGKSIHIDRLDEVLTNADLIFCATASDKILLTKEQIHTAQLHRKYKPLVLVDVCIPRNIDEACSEVKGVFRFDIDAIGNLRDENIAHRQAEAAKAKVYVEQAVSTLNKWFDSRGISDQLKAFKQIVDDIFEQELSKTIKKQSWINADPELHKNIEGLIGSIKSKIMIEYKKKANDEL